MGFKESAKMIAGGMAVYVAMAACGASDSHGPANGATGDGVAGQQNSAQGGATDAGTGGTLASSGASMGTSGAEGVSGSAGAMAMAGAPAGGGTTAAGGKASGGSNGGSMMNPVKPAMADPVSGTRLKANYINGSDGSKQWAMSWHDSMLNVDCTFGKAIDGSLRCLPAAAATGHFFAESLCTQPLAEVPTTSCGAAPTPSLVYSGQCDSTSYYAPGDYINYSPIYTLDTNGNCTSIPTPQNYIFYKLGAVVDVGQFVSATTSSE